MVFIGSCSPKRLNSIRCQKDASPRHQKLPGCSTNGDQEKYLKNTHVEVLYQTWVCFMSPCALTLIFLLYSFSPDVWFLFSVLSKFVFYLFPVHAEITKITIQCLRCTTAWVHDHAIYLQGDLDMARQLSRANAPGRKELMTPPPISNSPPT